MADREDEFEELDEPQPDPAAEDAPAQQGEDPGQLEEAMDELGAAVEPDEAEPQPEEPADAEVEFPDEEPATPAEPEEPAEQGLSPEDAESQMDQLEPTVGDEPDPFAGQPDAPPATPEDLARDAVQPQQGEDPAEYLKRMVELTKAADPLQREYARRAIQQFDAAASGNLDGADADPFPETQRLDANMNKGASIRAALSRTLETDVDAMEAIVDMLLDHDRKIQNILRRLEDERS